MFRLFKKKPCINRTEKKCKSFNLLEKLIYNPGNFSFVKAVDVASEICGADFVELKANVNFTSKYTELSIIEGLKDKIAKLHVNDTGITGINGALPDCYTEEYVLYNRASKDAVTDFFDIFNERILSLRYTYFKRQNIETLSQPIEQTVVGNIIFCLSGFDFFEIFKSQIIPQNRDISEKTPPGCAGIPEQFKISVQNLFWRYTRSSSGLRAMLSSFFKVPIEIRQFEGKFIKTIPGTQTIIGRNGKYNGLGRESILGDKIWDTTNGITILVGALNFEQYMKFLPKSSAQDQKFSALEKMKEIVRLYVPHGISVTLHFFLDECLVKKTALNGVNRLNKDAFISGIHSAKNAFFIERV